MKERHPFFLYKKRNRQDKQDRLERMIIVLINAEMYYIDSFILLGYIREKYRTLNEMEIVAIF